MKTEPIAPAELVAFEPATKTPRRSRLKLWLILSVPLVLFAGAAAYGFSYYEINQTLSKLNEIGGQYTTESSLDDRPEWVKEKFLPIFDRITQLYATGEEFDGAMLRSICKHAELEELTLDETSVTDEGLAVLSDQTELIRLKIDDSERGLIHTLPGWEETPALRALDYSVVSLDSTFVLRLAECRNLERLNFNVSEPFSYADADLSSLHRLVDLTVGEIFWVLGDDPEVVELERRISSPETSRGIMALFSSLPEVIDLKLLCLDLSNWDGLKHWSSGQTIARCQLNATKIDDEFARGLSQCVHLRTFNYHAINSTDDFLSPLASSKRLRYLDLSSTDPFSQELIDGLTQLQQVSELTLSNVGSTKEVFEQLHRMQGLRTVNLSGPSLDKSDVSALVDATQLQKIHIAMVVLFDESVSSDDEENLNFFVSEEEIADLFRSFDLQETELIQDIDFSGSPTPMFPWETDETLNFQLPEMRADGTWWCGS